MNKHIISILVLFLLLSTSFMGVSNQQEKVIIEQPSVTSNGGPINSSWPMYCHDVHHTGQSPYSTLTNTGTLVWKVWASGGMESSPAIGSDGTIYVGTYYGLLIAVNPNGTIKWQFPENDWATSSPAIADDGTIYVGSWNGYIHAINSNGTLKWRFPAGVVKSSPAIANDGTIYIGSVTAQCLFAIHPNGTLKWRFNTSDYIECSPAIGDDNTVYITSNNNVLYALFPENGTLKWQFAKGGFFGSPAIGDDGTIYVASQDKYLYAVYPNGTMKWRSPIGWGSGHVPSIATDGTIYIGGEDLYAIYPNGTSKWAFSPERFYDATSDSQAISADGTIYYSIGNNSGADRYLIAVNSYGQEIWREWIANSFAWSSPVIGSDGTVYVGAVLVNTAVYGILYAFNRNTKENHPPNIPSIQGETNGKINTPYFYTFVTTDPDGDGVSYLISWGDGTSENIGTFASGEKETEDWGWYVKGTYVIKAKAIDIYGAESDWATLTVTMPCLYNKPIPHFFEVLFQRFPHAVPILRHLVGC